MNKLYDYEVDGHVTTLWEDVKFWGAVIIITLALIALLGEVTGLVDWGISSFN